MKTLKIAGQTKFKVGDKVVLSKSGYEYIKEEKYLPVLIDDYYTVTSVDENEVDGDYYLLNASFEQKSGWATGFIEEELK